MLYGDEDDDDAYDYFPPVLVQTGGKSQRFTILGETTPLAIMCVKDVSKRSKENNKCYFHDSPNRTVNTSSSSTQ